MNIIDSAAVTSCGACKNGVKQPFPFSMAFQPIVDSQSETIFAYEALVRGPQGESAYSVLSQVTEENRYAFDQACRVKAISLAAKLGVAQNGAKLSVNFMPGAVYSPAACIQQTLKAARENNFPLADLIFEITEDERVSDSKHLQSIVNEYKKHGFTVALDDFGAGFSGLDLLSELEVDKVKIDARLIRNIDKRPRAAAIVRSIFSLCEDLNISVVSECVETAEEYRTLRDLGARLMQGYLFAKPMFEALPQIIWPDDGVPAEAAPATHLQPQTLM